MLLGNGAFVLLGLAFLAVGAVVLAAGQHLPVSSAAPANSGSANAQTASAQMPAGEWIALRSNAPADVLAAARQSNMLRQNLAGSSDHVSSVSRLGTPVLVRALQPTGAAAGQFPDFYVVPILNASGATTDAAELQLSPSHTAIQVIAIVTYSQPHPHGAIVQVTASLAAATVRTQQHVALRAGASAQLVYFPADAAAQETGQVMWTGSGEYPADPIWLVPGAEGRDHLVGDDGRIYSPAQLPIIKAGQ